MPYLNVIISIFDDLRKWGLAGIAALAGVVIVYKALGYQKEDESGRKQIKKEILDTILMAGGIYVILWIVMYVVEKMAAVG